MTNKVVKIGSLNGELDLLQAMHLKAELFDLCGVESVVKELELEGGQSKDIAMDLSVMNAKRFRTIEAALLNNEIDAVAYAMYNLHIDVADGICIAALSKREDCRDVLLIAKNAIAEDEELRLKKCAIIGVSSLIKRLQIIHLKPDAIVKEFNEGINSCQYKMDSGEYDAIIVSKDVLLKTKIDVIDAVAIDFHPAEFVPAPGQGVHGYMCRKDDIETRKLLLKLHHSDVAESTNVERKVMKLMKAGHHQQLGVHCQKDKNGYFHVHAAYAINVDEPLIKVSKSQSTVFNLAEEVVKEFQIFQNK